MTRFPDNTHFSSEIRDRISQLEACSPLAMSTVPIPRSDVELHALHPISIDALVDSAADDPELNLPYWAEIWPSGIALASEILTRPHVFRALPVIELGCGVGITAAAAMMAGANVVATDYSPHSLLLTELTCLINRIPPPALRQINWRSPDADLLQHSGERWPVVLAADVLYEQRDIEPMLATLDRITAPGGLVWLAELGRPHARTAIELARKRGWHIETTSLPGPWPGANVPDGEVWVHTMVKLASGY